MAGNLPPKRPVSDKDKDTILIPVASGLQELIFGNPGLFVDRPGFVSGPTPQTGLADGVQRLTRLNCRIWASRDKSGYSSRVNQYNADVCGPYLEGLGENPDEGFIEPPFEGGQCYTEYSYIYSFLNPNTGLNEDSNQTVSGRIIGLSVVFNANGQTKSGGIRRQLNPTSSIDFIPLGTTFNGSDLNQSIRNVQRQDGMPDDCGNPPTDVQPPATVTPGTPIVPTITVNLPGVGPTTINIDLGPDGTPTICAPDVEVCIDIDPSVEIGLPGGDGTGGDGTGGGPPPGDIGTPGTGDTAGGNDGDAEGEAPDGSVLVGLELNLTTIPEDARLYAPGVYRGVCYVYMGAPGNLDHDPAGAMVRDGQFIFAEVDNLTAWRVASNAGYVINVIPYYREFEP